jgi:hypothetical protein
MCYLRSFETVGYFQDRTFLFAIGGAFTTFFVRLRKAAVPIKKIR